MTGEATDSELVVDDERLTSLARQAGLQLAGIDMSSLRLAVNDILRGYTELDELVADRHQVERLQERAYEVPLAKDNPLGAWFVRADVGDMDGAGLLKGLRIAIKDNICVAGLPMCLGSGLLEGFTPTTDATVVTRVLAAGGRIAGKAVCENLSQGASSFTSVTGPVRNPYALDRASGGSSSGCAALVAAGEVDLAIGGDQGGSVRGPSSWCGIVGLKPTFGLVPYTGAVASEATLDTLGPMARSSEGCRKLLHAVAGTDGIDPRQGTIHGRIGQQIVNEMEGPSSPSRIAVLTEGFGWPGLSEPDVDHAVQECAKALRKGGYDVETISIPLHRRAIDIFKPILVDGGTVAFRYGLTNWPVDETEDVRRALHEGMRKRPDQLPLTATIRVLAGLQSLETRGGHYYAQARRLSTALTQDYERVLRRFDAILMPTLPIKAPLLPTASFPPHLHIQRSSGVSQNTCAANLTGHPAVSFPCGLSDGLPIGAMLVGRYYDDDRLLDIVDDYESRMYRIAPPYKAGELP